MSVVLIHGPAGGTQNMIMGYTWKYPYFSQCTFSKQVTILNHICAWRKSHVIVLNVIKTNMTYDMSSHTQAHVIKHTH